MSFLVFVDLLEYDNPDAKPRTKRLGQWALDLSGTKRLAEVLALDFEPTAETVWRSLRSEGDRATLTTIVRMPHDVVDVIIGMTD